MWGVAQMLILLEKLLNDLALQCCGALIDSSPDCQSVSQNGENLHRRDFSKSTLFLLSCFARGQRSVELFLMPKNHSGLL